MAPTGAAPWWRVGDEPARTDDHHPHELAGMAPGAAEPAAARPAASGPLAAALPRPSRAARPRRTPRAPAPGALAPARALAGAAVAVAGVVLGIGTLLWATGSPTPAGPVVGDAAATVAQPAVEPIVAGSTAPPAAPFVPPALVTAPPPPAAAPAAPAPALPAPAAAPPAPPAAPPTAAPRSLVVPVTVLNNSRRSGLAAQAAERFEAGGWPVRETGSLRGRIRATTVYYDPGQEASARAFAAAFRGIERVLPRIEGLPGRGLVVVVTRDFPV